METQIREYIVWRLSRGVNADDIAYDLCETHHLGWSEAEALVQQVTQEEKQAIAKRQFPILFAVGAGLFIVGAAILAEAFITLRASMQVISQPGGEPLSKFGMLAATIAAAPEIILRLALATAIMAGSLKGISKALYHFIYKD